MRTIIALSALALSAAAQQQAALAATWLGDNTMIDTATADWSIINTTNLKNEDGSAGDSVQVSNVQTLTVDSLANPVYLTWFTWQTLDDPALYLWAAIETTNNESFSNGDLTTVAIGASGFDETACQWTFDKSGGKVWEGPTIDDMWNGASDANTQDSTLSDLSYATSDACSPDHPTLVTPTRTWSSLTNPPSPSP